MARDVLSLDFVNCYIGICLSNDARRVSLWNAFISGVSLYFFVGTVSTTEKFTNPTRSRFAHIFMLVVEHNFFYISVGLSVNNVFHGFPLESLKEEDGLSYNIQDED